MNESLLLHLCAELHICEKKEQEKGVLRSGLQNVLNSSERTCFTPKKKCIFIIMSSENIYIVLSQDCSAFCLFWRRGEGLKFPHIVPSDVVFGSRGRDLEKEGGSVTRMPLRAFGSSGTTPRSYNPI